LAQDHILALMNAKGKLVEHCHVVAERLAEGWKPWSAHDLYMLVQVGDAITILDRLIKEEAPNLASPQTTASSTTSQAAPISSMRGRPASDCQVPI